MSGKTILAGLLQYREPLHQLLESTFRTMCTDMHLEVISPDDDNNFTKEDLNRIEKFEIIICDPRIFIKPAILPRLTNTKWVHCLFAGVDFITRHYDNKLSPPYVLTRNGGCVDTQMAEYVMGMIVARERHFIQLHENQKSKLWKPEYHGRKISDLTLGIVGFGAIGRTIAKVAKAFQMKICGLVQTVPAENQNDTEEAEYQLTSSLPELLSSCDYVCSVLPCTSSTDGFFDGDVLSHCKNKKTVFINIGRANVLKDSTILYALEQGWISHAIIDVFETEPLPVTSPLWCHPNVTVTPHNSVINVDSKQFAENFLKNYFHYVNGEPMNFVVNWKKGY